MEEKDVICDITYDIASCLGGIKGSGKYGIVQGESEAVEVEGEDDSNIVFI